MNHKNNNFFSVLVLALAAIFGFSHGIYAQNDCSAKIKEAQRYYDQGMIDEIPNMLASCMADGFTRTQKIEGYKLIIMSYLFDENQFEAEKTMLEFLKKYPEYEIMPNDPVEFVYLFESYRTASVFSFGLIGGFNFTDPRIIEPFTTFDMNEATLTNTIKPGFQVGVGVERYMSRKFLLNIEAFFSLNQYEFTDDRQDALSVSIVTFREKLYTVEIPVTISYEFAVKKTHFIARAGLSAAKITGVTGEPSRKYFPDLPAIPGTDMDIADYRKQMLYSGIVGVGLRYKVPRGIVSIDVRAKMGINNIVIDKKRWDNDLLLNQYHYLDDDFSLNMLSVSIGYYFSFYSPRKQR
jgi:hypothetical protein